jgi:hypothetical protein
MGEIKSDHAEWGRMYNELAQSNTSEVCASSRYGVISQRAIRRIESDVGAKLKLNQRDDLLDLGCGTGLIRVNLSKKVKEHYRHGFRAGVLLRPRGISALRRRS